MSMDEEVMEEEVMEEEEMYDELEKCKRFVVSIVANSMREIQQLSQRLNIIDNKVKDVDIKIDNVKQEIKMIQDENNVSVNNNISVIAEKTDKLETDSQELIKAMNDFQMELSSQVNSKITKDDVDMQIERFAVAGLIAVRGAGAIINTTTSKEGTYTDQVVNLTNGVDCVPAPDQNGEISKTTSVSNNEQAVLNNDQPDIAGSSYDFSTYPNSSTPTTNRKRKAERENEEDMHISPNLDVPISPAVEESQLYTSFEELPDELRKKLEPFNVNANMATKSKLNGVQASWIKYYVKNHLRYGFKKSDISKLLTAGHDTNVWNVNDALDDGVLLSDYIVQRLKYEQRAFRQKRETCESLLEKELNKK